MNDEETIFGINIYDLIKTIAAAGTLVTILIIYRYQMKRIFKE